MTMSTRNERLAWAAGFFDGEGNVSIKRHAKRGQYWLVVSVAQVSIEPLLILKELFDGSLQNKKTARAEWADIYVWTASSRQAMAALRAMQPWLIVKASHVVVAEEFTSAMASRGNQARGSSPPRVRYQQLRELMASLNVRGPRRERLPLIEKHRLASSGEQLRLLS